MAEEKYLFKLTRLMLLVSGLWPLDIPNVSKFHLILYKVYYVINHVIYCTVPFAFAGTLFYNINVNGPQVMESFSRMTFVILILFKLTIIRSKEMKDIISLVTAEEMQITHSNDYTIKKIYRFHVKYCTKMVFAIVVFLYAAGFINLISGCYDIHQWNLATNRTTVKPHIVQLWLPFDTDQHFSLAIAYETCHIFQTLAINGSIVALLNSVMVFLRANLKVLQYQIKSFDRDSKGVRSRQAAEVNLKQMLIRHQLIIDWVNDLNGSFKNILLLDYSVLSLQLATTLIQIIQLVRIPFNATFFLHSLLQFFGLAWNANEILLESSNGMLEALYESDWYEWDGKLRLPIYMMMVRCRRPLVMRIGPLGTLDLNAAVSRVKLAYTCLSVL